MIKTIIVIGIAVAVGFLAGNGLVYGFNRLPDSWLGTEEPDRHWQRVKSYPWKYVLAATMIICGIYTGLMDTERAPGIFVSAFILIWIAMSAKLYRLAPRPLIWMLLICGVGMIPFEHAIKNSLLGAAVMFVCGGIICVVEYFMKKPYTLVADSIRIDDLDDASADSGTDRKLKIAHTDLWELMVVVGFLTGLVQSLIVLQVALLSWAIRSLIPARERATAIGDTVVKAYKSDGREMRTKSADRKVFSQKEVLSFYFAICSAIWIVINIGHKII